jgi:hypothetical protein
MPNRRRTYSRDELAEVAAGLRRILDAIARDELSAEPGEINRLEGAAAALDALADERAKARTRDRT